MRGTTRGNAIVGTVIGVVEVTWILYENGWGGAFYRPEFYEQVVGGIGGLTFGLAGGGAIAPFVGEYPVLGPLLVFGAGAVTGTAGYLGGASAAHMIIEMIFPEMIQRQERERIASITDGIDRSIASLRDWKPVK